MRYAQDWRSLGCVAVTIAMLAAPHLWNPPGWLTGPWLVAAAFFCFASSIVNHNHMHCPVFVRDWMNQALNLALTLARGHTASGVIVPHNLNHHVVTNEEGDWIHPRLAGTGLGWARLARYIVRASANMALQRLRAGAPRLPGPSLPGVTAEKLTILTAVALACWHDWAVFLSFNVVPWLAGLALLVGVNLLQHDSCAPDELGGSRNFTSAVGNWLLFNNGFHTAHHMRPLMHWSELPELHQALRDGLVRRGLESRSIMRFLWEFGWSHSAKLSAHG